MINLRIISYNGGGITVKVIQLVVLLCVLQIQLASSLRVSRKCQYGHYFNDGCVTCWCDPGNGHSVCEHMTSCPRKKVKCPMGRKYHDECENECTCYETTGAIFCKEKGQCNSVRRRNVMLESSHQNYDEEEPKMELDHRTVPDSISIPKEDLIIEPALIIRRKSFSPKSRNDSPHHPHKNPTTLLYLYEKQLKSMNEFRNYYNKYLDNDNNNNDDNHSQGSIHTNSYAPRLKPKQNQRPTNIKVHIPLNPLFSFASHKKKEKPGMEIPSPDLRPPPTTTTPHSRYDWSAKKYVTFRPLLTSERSVTPRPTTFRPYAPSSTTHRPSSSTQRPIVTSRPFLTSASSNRRPLTVTSRPLLSSASSINHHRPGPDNSPMTFRIPLHGSSITKRPVTFFSVSTPAYTPFKVTIEDTLIQKGQQEHSTPILSEVILQKAIEEDPTPYLFVSTRNPFRFISSTMPPTVSIHKEPEIQEQPGQDDTYEYNDYKDPSSNFVSSSTPRPRPLVTSTRKPFTISVSTQKPRPTGFSYSTMSQSWSDPYSSTTSRPLFSEDNYEYNDYKEDTQNNFVVSPSTRRPLVSIVSASTRRPLMSSSTRRPVAISLSTQRPKPQLSYSYSTMSQSWSEPFSTTSRPLFSSTTFPPENEISPTIRAELNKPIFLNHIIATHKYPEIYSHKQYIPPRPKPRQNPHEYQRQKPKQYRLYLKNEERKPLFYSNNNRVPQFVDKIAREFFRKPAIFIPKIKHDRHHNKPQLELERVVYDHKEMIPSELILEPGGQPMKVQFTSNAERQMERDREWRNSQDQLQGQFQGQGVPEVIYHNKHSQHIPRRNHHHKIHHHHHHTFSSEHRHTYPKPIEHHVTPSPTPIPHTCNEYPEEHLFRKPEPEVPQWNYDTPVSHNFDYKVPLGQSHTPSDYPEQVEVQPNPNKDDYQDQEIQFPKEYEEIPPEKSDYELPLPPYTATEPEADYNPVSPRPGPSFEIPREELDDFTIDSSNHHDLFLPQPEKTIIIDSIQKSPEIKQTHSHYISDGFHHRDNSEHKEPNTHVKVDRQEIHEVFEHKSGQPQTIPMPTTFKPSYSIPANSAEIDHDQIIREILAMDPEIGADAVIIKSDGQTIPPPTKQTTTTTKSPLEEMQMQASTQATKILENFENFDKNSPQIPQINLKADSGIITFDYSSTPPNGENRTTESPFESFYRELFQTKRENKKPKPDGTVDTEGVAKIFKYDLQKSHQVYESSSIVSGGGENNNNKRTLDKRDETVSSKASKNSEKNETKVLSSFKSSTERVQRDTTTVKTIESSVKPVKSDKSAENTENTQRETKEVKPEVESPSSSFKKELDWKSGLMSNICDINPNSALCLTYKSLCMLMATR